MKTKKYLIYPNLILSYCSLLIINLGAIVFLLLSLFILLKYTNVTNIIGTFILITLTFFSIFVGIKFNELIFLKNIKHTFYEEYLLLEINNNSTKIYYSDIKFVDSQLISFRNAPHQRVIIRTSNKNYVIRTNFSFLYKKEETKKLNNFGTRLQNKVGKHN